jgi:hypothetical protein
MAPDSRFFFPQALAQAERRSQRSRGVTAMAVSPDGSRLLAAYADSTVRRACVCSLFHV